MSVLPIRLVAERIAGINPDEHAEERDGSAAATTQIAKAFACVRATGRYLP